jgi:hypothetical protein
MILGVKKDHYYGDPEFPDWAHLYEKNNIINIQRG